MALFLIFASTISYENPIVFQHNIAIPLVSTFLFFRGHRIETRVLGMLYSSALPQISPALTPLSIKMKYYPYIHYGLITDSMKTGKLKAE